LFAALPSSERHTMVEHSMLRRLDKDRADPKAKRRQAAPQGLTRRQSMLLQKWETVPMGGL
jgi:hypothetical protein